MSLLELCLLPDKVTVLTYYLLTMNARLYLCCVDIVFMVCSCVAKGARGDSPTMGYCRMGTGYKICFTDDGRKLIGKTY